MTKPFLASVEVNPEAPSVASVIWMHGLGANGYDFASVPPQLGLPSELAVRYVFPHAPSIPVTINQGASYQPGTTSRASTREDKTSPVFGGTLGAFGSSSPGKWKAGLRRMD